ncbi:MAG: secretin N-terminal domain-containing protein, partial [Parachlamydiaceae bacterium]
MKNNMYIRLLINTIICLSFITVLSTYAAAQKGQEKIFFSLDSDDPTPSAPSHSISTQNAPKGSSTEMGSKDSNTGSFLYTIPEPKEDPVENLTAAREPTTIAATVAPDFSPIETSPSPRTALINFNNVSMVEYIRFVSRISNRNFVFDENDLQFNVTIISEEPATIENIMTALLQELRIHDLQLIEDNNNLIIHKNAKVTGISQVVADGIPEKAGQPSDIVTQVFRLNTLDTDKAVVLIRPLVSDSALVEPLKDNNQLVVTDITANVNKIAQLLKSLDAPNSSLVIGQYVSRLTPIDTLIPLAQQIMLPISLDQTLSFIPHPTTNSIFIVASPFLVERTISILEYLDQDQGATRILDLNDLKFGGTKISPKQLKTLSGQWINNAQGNWMFQPEANLQS